MKFLSFSIFFISIVLLQPLLWKCSGFGIKPLKTSSAKGYINKKQAPSASFSSEKKQGTSFCYDEQEVMFDQKYQPSTSSCTDRCHVNYLAYRTIYQGKVFRHKTHSLNHGLACNQCHDSSPVNMEMHGRLVIQNKDCWTCHHRKTDKIPINPLSLKNNASSGENSDKPLVKSISANEDGCLKCHADVRAYINGNIKNSISKKPDWMFNAVSCTDCHKLEPEGYSFKAVRENCVECHNPDYGLLYDAWKETLSSKTKQFYKKDINKDIHDILRLVQLYGMHNFRLSQMLLESIEQ